MVALVVHFSKLRAPRVDRTKKHPLINIIVIGLCAVICGTQRFTEMEESGQARRQWLSECLELSNGIPSHDTFNNVFARLDPVVLQQCLLSWTQSLFRVARCQSSYDRSDPKAVIQMVTVWRAANLLALGRRVVDEKINVVKAIPQLSPCQCR